MAKFKTLYEKHDENAEIAASGNEIFFTSTEERENKDKHGSFNYLEIINDTTTKIKVRLDNLSTRERVLFGKSTLVIDAEEDTRFNSVQLINTDAVNVVAAAGLKVVAKIQEPAD